MNCVLLATVGDDNTVLLLFLAQMTMYTVKHVDSDSNRYLITFGIIAKQQFLRNAPRIFSVIAVVRDVCWLGLKAEGILAEIFKDCLLFTLAISVPKVI